MPKLREELQFPSMDNIQAPYSGFSLFNEDGALKIKHWNGDIETVAVINDRDFQFHNANYYTKSEVRDLIDQAGLGVQTKTVSELPARPAAGDEKKIFLVSNGISAREYLYIGTGWEEIGGVDLSNYITRAEFSQSTLTAKFRDWTV